jgi:ribose transport system substrate-binding protein
MKARKVLTIALMILVIAGTVFAAGQQEGKEGRMKVLGVSLPTPDHGWVGAVVANAQDQVRDMGVTARIVTAHDVNKQASDIEDLIAMGVDAIVMLPVDGSPLTPAAQRVMEAGIPLVVFDREIDTEDYSVTIKGDNYGIGVNAAKYLVDVLNSKGKVFMLSGIPCSVTTLRDKGFKDTIEGTELEVVGLQDGGYQRGKGYQVMQNALTAHPQIDAVFAIDDEMALGALQAIKEAGRTDVKYLTAAGGAKEFYETITSEKNIELSTFLYSPLMIKEAVKIGVDLMNGGAVKEKMIVIPADGVGRANVSDYYDEYSNY